MGNEERVTLIARFHLQENHGKRRTQPMRRVLSHLIAAAAYGLLLQSIVFAILLTRYHATRAPGGFGRYVSFFDVAGYHLDPQRVVVATIATCTVFPLLVALGIAWRRPQPALQGTTPMVIHSMVIIVALLAHFLILLFSAFLGRDGPF